MIKKLLLGCLVAGSLTANADTVVTFDWAPTAPADTLNLMSSPLGANVDVDTVLTSATKQLVLPGQDIRIVRMQLPDQWAVRFYTIPGEKVNVTVADADLQVSGSRVTNTVDSLRRQDFKSMHQMVAIYNMAEAAGAGADSIAMQQIMAIEDQVRDMYAQYIQNNLTDPASVMMLRELPEDMAMEYVNKIDPQAIDPVYRPIYDNMKSTLEANAERRRQIEEARSAVAVGAVAPDFTLPSADGKQVSLSSLRGKWVLLDFWGSWCGWCLKGIPQMKEYYEKYSDKCTFVGLDFYDTPEAWKAAIERYELPWLQLYVGLRDSAEAKALSTKYAIEGFPTKLVIDPEGKVYKYVVGEDPTFYDDFKELFK